MSNFLFCRDIILGSIEAVVVRDWALCMSCNGKSEARLIMLRQALKSTIFTASSQSSVLASSHRFTRLISCFDTRGLECTRDECIIIGHGCLYREFRYQISARRSASAGCCVACILLPSRPDHAFPFATILWDMQRKAVNRPTLSESVNIGCTRHGLRMHKFGGFLALGAGP